MATRHAIYINSAIINQQPKIVNKLTLDRPIFCLNWSPYSLIHFLLKLIWPELSIDPPGDKGSPSNPPIRAQVSGIIEDSVQLVWETSLSLRSFEIVVFFDVDKEYRRLHVYDFRNVSIDRLEPGQTYSFMVGGRSRWLWLWLLLRLWLW